MFDKNTLCEIFLCECEILKIYYTMCIWNIRLIFSGIHITLYIHALINTNADKSVSVSRSYFQLQQRLVISEKFPLILLPHICFEKSVMFISQFQGQKQVNNFKMF